MNNWQIKINLLSRLYQFTITRGPFQNTKHNKNLLESLSFEKNRYRDIDVPIEDYVKLRVVGFTQIIPIEELKHFVKRYDLFVNSKCKRQPFYNQRDSIDYFDNIALWDGGWFNLGFSELTNCNVVDNFSAYAYRLTDSFVQISFYLTVSDLKCYEFYKLLRNHHDIKISLMTKKHPVLFRNQSMRIFNPALLRNSDIYNYFKLLKKEIILLFQENKMIFHIANVDSISFLNVLSFKRIHRYNDSIHETFWNSFHLDKHFCFTDKENRYYFPELMNFENDIGILSNYLFVNDENFKLISGFGNIEHQLRSELHDWGMNLIRNLAIQDVLNDHYRNISNFRMNYFNVKNSIKYLSQYNIFQTTNYWISLFSKEYFSFKRKTSSFYSPTLVIDRFDRQTNLLDILDRNNTKKIQALNSLSSFIDTNITKFNDYRILKINKKTQNTILCLTLITVIIGIIQISQLDVVETLVNDIFVILKDNIFSIIKYLRNLTTAST